MSERMSYVVVGSRSGLTFAGNGVVAVFSDKAVADRFVEVTKAANWHEPPFRVVEVPTDPFLQPLLGGLRPYEVGADNQEAVMVRIDGDPTERTIWAVDPDSARLIQRRTNAPATPQELT